MNTNQLLKTIIEARPAYCKDINVAIHKHVIVNCNPELTGVRQIMMPLKEFDIALQHSIIQTTEDADKVFQKVLFNEVIL